MRHGIWTPLAASRRWPRRQINARQDQRRAHQVVPAHGLAQHQPSGQAAIQGPQVQTGGHAAGPQDLLAKAVGPVRPNAWHQACSRDHQPKGWPGGPGGGVGLPPIPKRQKAATPACRPCKWPPNARWRPKVWATFFAARHKQAHDTMASTIQPSPATHCTWPKASHWPLTTTWNTPAMAITTPKPLAHKKSARPTTRPRPPRSARVRRRKSARCSWPRWFVRLGKPKRRKSACPRRPAPSIAQHRAACCAVHATSSLAGKKRQNHPGQSPAAQGQHVRLHHAGRGAGHDVIDRPQGRGDPQQGPAQGVGGCGIQECSTKRHFALQKGPIVQSPKKTAPVCGRGGCKAGAVDGAENGPFKPPERFSSAALVSSRAWGRW